MFKIAKILNSQSGVPQTVRLGVTTSFNYRMGSVMTLASGKAAPCSATTKPFYVAAQDRPAGTGSHIVAYPLTEDIVLDVAVNADPSSLKIGDSVTLALSQNQALGVTATTEGGVAKIYDLQGASKAGDHILVRFIG